MTSHRFIRNRQEVIEQVYYTSGIISSANSLSSLIMRMGKTLQPGDNITDAPFPPAFQKILLDAEEYSNETIYLDNIFITFSKIAIKLEDEIVSWVVTFRDTNIRNIDQAQERQIKKRAAHYSFSDIVGENPRNTQMYRNSAAVCEIF